LILQKDNPLPYVPEQGTGVIKPICNLATSILPLFGVIFGDVFNDLIRSVGVK